MGASVVMWWTSTRWTKVDRRSLSQGGQYAQLERRTVSWREVI